jgi:hypothetical protein
MGTTPSSDGPGPVTNEPEDGPDVAKIATLSAAVIGVVLILGALALFGGRTAMSVATGAIIAVANLVTMRAIIRSMLRPVEAEAEAEARAKAAVEAAPGPHETPAPPPIRDHAAEGKRGGAAWGIFAVLKIFVLFGGIWILLTRGLVDPIPLVVGYGILPLGIAVSGLLTSLSPRPRGRGRQARMK